MKQFFEFIPLVAFCLGYYLVDFFFATTLLIIATVIQVTLLWIITKSVPKMQLCVLAMVVVFGGLTLMFKDERFVIWKVSVIYWLLGATLLIAPLFTKQPLIKKMLKSAEIAMPDHAWSFLNISWAIFFIFIGGLNLVIANIYDMDTWVNFKVFGVTGLSFAFMVVSVFYMMKHMQPQTDSNTSK